MILTELPDLPPRPETPANAAFRRDYVARWGNENTLLCGLTRLAEYPTVVHPLSIKMAWGGREVYRLRRREVHVRDGSYLVLNDGDEYGSVLSSERPATSFSIFLRRGLARRSSLPPGSASRSRWSNPARRRRQCRSRRICAPTTTTSRRACTSSTTA